MQPRTVGVIAVMSLALGWLASGVVSQDSPAPVRAQVQSGPRPLGGQDPVAPYTQQLRLKLQDHPRSPSPGRNPFAFGSRKTLPTSLGPAALREAETPAATAEPPAAASLPIARFDLSGIAMSKTDDAEVFTAIIVDNGSLVFAKAGDALSAGFKVVRVDETAVVIADAAGVEQTLRLK